MATLVIALAWRRFGARGRIAAGVFLLLMISVDIWVAHVLRNNPSAWNRQTCGWVEGRTGWHQACL
jgi:hypothetical protein